MTERRGWSARVGAELETVGVLPVPDGQRVMRPWRMFLVWLMAASSATTPPIGQLLFDYGLANFVIACLPAWPRVRSAGRRDGAPAVGAVLE